MRRDNALKIPPQTEFSAIGGLSAESCDLLQRFQPETIGQASRILWYDTCSSGCCLAVSEKRQTTISKQG